MANKPHPMAYVISAAVVIPIMAAAVFYVAGMLFLLFSEMPVAGVGMSTWLDYMSHYGDIKSVNKKLHFSMIGAVGICVVVPAFAVFMATGNKRKLHGAARFANDAEIRKSGLLADKGVMVGKHKGKYLMFGGQQFVILAAPTRAGKGVGIVIPNLLTYPDSVVVLDVKQENYDITAGFRAKHGHEVFLFNPFAEDMRTHRYNPLGYISDNPHFRIGDILAIGQAFWSGEGKDPFFDDQARNLFLGLCLYVCETPGLPRTMGELLRQSSGKGMPIKEYLQGLIEARNFTDVDGELIPKEWSDGDEGLPPLTEECVDALNRFTSTSDNTLASILASFNAPLVIWSNPIVDAATSANDFDLRDVRRKRMTVYIGITPDHLAEAGLLVNVLFSQLVNLNTKELPQKNAELKYQCLLLMDEFTAIGKVKIIAKAVSYMAGYNLRLLPIIQSVSQLASVYGQEDARTFITNHALQIYFAPREQKDANEYSEMLGYETVKSTSIGRQIGGKSGRSENESDQRRALLLPQELKELGTDKEIISLENTKPILCEKIRYYEDKLLTARLMDAPAVPTLDLDKHIAYVQNRTREMTADEARGGIDLSSLAVELDAVPSLDADFVASAEEVKGYVDSLFGAMGISIDADELDGGGEAHTDDEPESAAGEGTDAPPDDEQEGDGLAGDAELFLDGDIDNNDSALDDIDAIDFDSFPLEELEEMPIYELLDEVEPSPTLAKASCIDLSVLDDAQPEDK